MHLSTYLLPNLATSNTTLLARSRRYLPGVHLQGKIVFMATVKTGTQRARAASITLKWPRDLTSTAVEMLTPRDEKWKKKKKKKKNIIKSSYEACWNYSNKSFLSLHLRVSTSFDIVFLYDHENEGYCACTLGTLEHALKHLGIKLTRVIIIYVTWNLNYSRVGAHGNENSSMKNKYISCRLPLNIT